MSVCFENTQYLYIISVMEQESNENGNVGGSSLFTVKLIALNFLFVASIYTGKSVLYLLADFALFAFVGTFIYVNAVALLMKKRLLQPQEPVEYLSKDDITPKVGQLVGFLNQFITLVLTGSMKQNIALVIVLVIAAAVSYIFPTIIVVWAVSLLILLNDGAESSPALASIKDGLFGKVGDLLGKVGLKDSQAVQE